MRAWDCAGRESVAIGGEAWRGLKMHGNHCKRWTDSDVDELRLLASENMHIGLIARRLNRTSQSIRAKATQLHTSLARTRVKLT